MKGFILTGTFVSNTAYSFIAPFLPIVYAEKGVSPETIGWIFAMYSLSVVVFSPLIPKLLAKNFDKKQLINTALFVMSICFLLFGYSIHIQDVNLLVGVAITLRGFQGAASALI